MTWLAVGFVWLGLSAVYVIGLTFGRKVGYDTGFAHGVEVERARALEEAEEKKRKKAAAKVS